MNEFASPFVALHRYAGVAPCAGGERPVRSGPWGKHQVTAADVFSLWPSADPARHAAVRIVVVQSLRTSTPHPIGA